MRASVSVLVFGMFGAVLLVAAGVISAADGAVPPALRAFWVLLAGVGAIWIVFSIRQLVQLRRRGR